MLWKMFHGIAMLRCARSRLWRRWSVPGDGVCVGEFIDFDGHVHGFYGDLMVI
jgi:hypothetical protein